MSSVELAFTTCYKPAPSHLERARLLSERFAAPLVERAAWDATFAASGARFLYVVTRAHEELRDASGATCFVQEGLLSSKLTSAADPLDHPFMRAVGADCTSLLDGTLGLANDAVHVAVVLGCPITGVEASPVLHALLEEGLPRLTRSYPNAARISLVHGNTLEVLRTMADGAVDVVTLDPMMSRAKKSAPSFNLLRHFALADRASPDLLREAARVAKKRVVLKLGKGAPLPPGSPLAFSRRENGGNVVYWVNDAATP